MPTLMDAMESRDLAAVRDAIRRNPAEARWPRAIVKAGAMGWQEAAALLIENGADPNAMHRGYRALHALMQESPHEVADRPSPERVACFEWLLAHGADPDMPAAWPPARALLIAAFVGEPQYVFILRKTRVQVDDFVSAALGELPRVRQRIEKDPGFAQARDINNFTALHCCAASRMGRHSTATRKRLLGIATLLLDHDADLTAKVKGWDHELDAVYFAASSNQPELFELLLQRGADATAALTTAAWQKEDTWSDVALRYGAKPDLAVDGSKPLLNQLVRWGQFRGAYWLLKNGASPNRPDERGWTAVHQAASRGNERMLKAIMEAGGDASRKDNDGVLPTDLLRRPLNPKLAALLK